jgi:hypothetical protein
MNARFVTEAGLDQEFAVHAKLESKGNYGCGCAVFDGDVTLTELAFEDEWFQDLTERNHPADVGTVLFSGNVHCKDTSVSDRLMCLIIMGDLVVEGALRIFETEVLVCGNAKVGSLLDRDRRLRVLGTLTVGDPGVRQ